MKISQESDWRDSDAPPPDLVLFERAEASVQLKACSALTVVHLDGGLQEVALTAFQLKRALCATSRRALTLWLDLGR